MLDADSVARPTNRSLAILRQGLWRPSACSSSFARPAPRQVRQVTVCADPSPTAVAAIHHVSRLSKSYGLAIRIVHPYHLSSLELEYRVENADFDPALDVVAQREIAEEFARRLPTGLLDLDTVDVAYREVPNWDYAGHLISVASHEQTDLLVLPLSHYVMFEALRQKELIRRIARSIRKLRSARESLMRRR